MAARARTGSETSAGPRQARPSALDRRVRRVAAVMTWGPASIGSPAGRWAVNILALGGAALLVVSAVIHLHLWTANYGGIAIIGPMFLAQGVTSILVAVAVGVFRRIGLLVAGAGLMAATAVGLLLSVWIGLFGFRDSLASPYAGASLVVEFGSAGLLLAGAGLILAAGSPFAGRFTGRGIPGRNVRGRHGA